MSGSNEPTVTEEAVRQLARMGDLPMDADRSRVLALMFEALILDANEVNRFMAGRRDVSPMVRVLHPEIWQEGR